MEKLKLYKVIVSFYQENKETPHMSFGGQDYLLVSALSSKNAKQIGLKIFGKRYKDYELTLNAKPIKLPKLITLNKEGVLYL